MGYTHYWRGEIKDWPKASRDIVRLLEASPVPLADGLGNGGTSPVITPDSITFNGLEDDSHETCQLTREGTPFDCCKTAFKPYDVVVTAALVIAASHGLRVSSDGEEKHWEAGLALARTIDPDLTMPQLDHDDD